MTPDFQDPLPRIGPTEPAIRAYVTDVGTLTVNFATLERDIILFLGTLLGFTKFLKDPPEPWLKISDRLERLPLGPLIKELRAVIGDDGAALIARLDGLNQQRIRLIHRPLRFADEQGKINYDAVFCRRRRLRALLSRLRPAQTAVVSYLSEFLDSYLALAEQRLGKNDPRVASMQQYSAVLRAQIQRRPHNVAQPKERQSERD